MLMFFWEIWHFQNRFHKKNLQMPASAISCYWKMFRPKDIFKKISHSIWYSVTCAPRDKCITMVAAPPPNFRGGGLKISDHNNWGRDLSKKLNLGGEPMNPNDVMVVVLKTILLCWLGFRFIYIVCVTTTNMLVFWSASLSCLPVCQSNFNGWFRSQGKYRATLEFKSSGCAVTNNVIYDWSLSLSVSVKFTYCAPPPPFCRVGGWASNHI